MPNAQNLRPCEHKFTQEEASKGGKNSAKAKKERKIMQQQAQMLLDMALHSGKKASIENIKSIDELANKNIDASTAILLKQLTKAFKGDTAAAIFLRDTAGQKPIDRVMTAEVDPSVIEEVERMVMESEDDDSGRSG